jgi:hypothetical protein
VKSRLLLLGLVVLVATAGATGYVVWQRNRTVAPVPVASAGPVTGGPRLVFRNTQTGGAYGRIAVVPLAKPDGPRTVVPVSCDRLDARAGLTLCLHAVRGLVTTYQLQLLSPQWTVVHSAPLAGLPSRARLSPDGSLFATTTFVYGDSYTNPGQFSTRTVIARANGSHVADLESYRLIVNGRTLTASDRNLWGVTFVDHDAFYATAASGGKTWLVKGSIAAGTLTALREDAECPSLSPDGTRVAFKKRGDLPRGQWRLAVYDLATGRETVLAETRSVDDQVVWLDDDTIGYGLPRANGSDVWAVPADGTGTAHVLVPDAWSPAVVR